MSARVLLIPAAGLGSRLGAAVPKLLVPVGGMPMIDRLRDLYAADVSRIVLVVHPSFEGQVRAHVVSWTMPVTVIVQEQPSGMLDAIMLAATAALGNDPEQVWITWCDQVAVHPATVARLAATAAAAPDAAVTMPTVRRSVPYIHLARDAAGRIVNVLHRREGDVMPEDGESDMGLFALSATACRELLPRYAAHPAIGRVTGERNFLPFLGWLAPAHRVVTFPAVDELEAVGVNTPADLAVVEQYLHNREHDQRPAR